MCLLQANFKTQLFQCLASRLCQNAWVLQEPMVEPPNESFSSHSGARPVHSILLCMLDFDQCIWKVLSAGALHKESFLSMYVSRSVAWFVTIHCLMFRQRLCTDICENALKLSRNTFTVYCHAAAMCVHPGHCRSGWATHKFHVVSLTRTCHGNLRMHQPKRGCWFG